MGEIADMMLEGVLCAGCGVYLDEEEPSGFPVYCDDCRQDGFNDEAIAQRKPEKIRCPKCYKKCGGQQGLDAHMKAKHT